LLLNEVKEVEQLPFAKVKNAIQRQLIPQYSDSLNTLFYGLIDDLEAKYNVEYKKDNMSTLLNLIENSGDNNPNTNRNINLFVETLSEDDKNLELATFNKGGFTVADLMDIYSRIRPSRRPKLESVDKIEEMVSRNLARKLITQYGYEKNYDRDSEVSEKVDTKKQDMMVDHYKRDKFVRPVVSQEDVQTYYDENKDDYQTGIKMQVQEIFVDSQEEAQDIVAKLDAGGDFDILAERFNTRQKTKDNKGMLGWISPRQYSVIGRTANTLKVGEISSPIRVGSHYSIVRVLDRTFEGYQDLAQVQNTIRQQLYSKKENQAYREWIEELGNSLQVSINEKLILEEYGFEQTAD